MAAAPRGSSPSVANELDLAVLELDEGAAFSVGAEPKPLLLNARAGSAFGANDGEGLVGTGASFVAGDHAWFGVATTLPRRRP